MAKVKIVRVRIDRIAAVQFPGSTGYIVPDPKIPYRSDDPLVIAYPWMFENDEDAAAEVEEASANPSERRRIGRPPLPRDSEGNIIRD